MEHQHIDMEGIILVMSRKKISFNEVEKLANIMIDLPGVPKSINKVAGAIVSTSVVYDVDPNICKGIMV